jgi:hypothetical protein
MALITKAQIDAKLALGERVFLNLSNQAEKDINVPAESPVSDPTLPIPYPILGADGNAVGIMGKAISTSAPVNGDYIRYDSATDKWVFAAGSGGGGGSTITVRAVDGTPTNTTATLQFQETSGFTLATSLDTTTIDILAVPVNKLAALTASRAVATDSSGFLVATSTPVAKLGFLDNVTSDIQAQINTLSSGGSGITALTGDVTASGIGSVAATLASVGTAGTYTKVTTDAKGRITSGTTLVSGDLPSHTSTHAFSGLSGISLSSPTSGQVLQFNGTNWINATTSSSGNAAVFTFMVAFDGSGLPASTSSLPSGWSTSISGSEITVTHNTGVPPCAVSYFGLDTSGTPTWRYRLPTASNEVKFLNSAMTTQFIVTVNHTITGASLSSSAKVNIFC